MDIKTAQRIAAGLARSGALFTCGALAEHLCHCCRATDAALELAESTGLNPCGVEHFSRFFCGYGMDKTSNLWLAYARMWSQATIELQELFILGLFNLALMSIPVQTAGLTGPITPGHH